MLQSAVSEWTERRLTTAPIDTLDKHLMSTQIVLRCAMQSHCTVFCCSWGYDQTNVDYYQVLSVSNKTATFCKIAQLSESDGYLQGNCVPATNHFIGKPFKKLIQKSSVESNAFIKIASYANAYKIEPVAVVSNKPIYESSHWTAYA